MKKDNKEPVVRIVWGSPASGKTTYVKKNMEDGDLVVDLAPIKEALSLKGKTDSADTLLNTALSVREHLYDLIRSRKELDCKNVWVIGGFPTKAERKALKDRIKAKELVFIEATIKQCKDRAKKDNTRKDKEKQMMVIDKWFEKYEKDSDSRSSEEEIELLKSKLFL